MKKRTFLKLSSTLLTTAAIASCVQKTPPGKNWAGNIEYSSDQTYEPATIDELRSIIQGHDHIKAQGTCHSFNTIADSTYGFVRLTKLNQVVSLDEANMTVTVQAGIRYGELCKYLESKGYALHNLASLPHISVGGSIATATHGSGVKNQNLSSAVRSMKIMNAAGEIIDLPGDLSVHLGALGVVTEVTLAIQPTYQVRQFVYQHLPMSSLKDHFMEIMSAGYSVSLFTDWSNDINQVWVKKTVAEGDAPAELFGATAATKDLHPIESISAVNCTPQMGVPGPWHERLPHFKLDFTPSAGEELQAEYFVPLANGYDAIEAVYALREKITPLLQISEVRTIASDGLLMSPMHGRDTLAIHFTWKKDWDGVRNVLPLIEETLSKFDVRPHWGKLFTIDPEVLQGSYRDDLAKFSKLTDGKFINEFLQKNLLS
ncbi:MAG TPA: FAD-binding protein [Cyclobacteriaceae bacterium]